MLLIKTLQYIPVMSRRVFPLGKNVVGGVNRIGVQRAVAGGVLCVPGIDVVT